jgi:hypothetical protein
VLDAFDLPWEEVTAFSPMEIDGSRYICTVGALCAMSALELLDAYGIFLRFMSNDLKLGTGHFLARRSFVQISVNARPCVVIEFTTNILNEIQFGSVEGVRCMQLVGYMHVGGHIHPWYESGSPSSWPALILFCDVNLNILETIECNRSNMRKFLRKSITRKTVPPNAVAAMEEVLDVSDVFDIFREFMRTTLQDPSLNFSCSLINSKGRKCGLIELEEDILSKIQIEAPKKIHNIELFGCEDGFEMVPASIWFLTFGMKCVQSIKGNSSVLYSELGRLIRFEINVSQPKELLPAPSLDAYIAQLDQIIRACTAHPDLHNNPESDQVIQICNELKLNHKGP